MPSNELDREMKKLKAMGITVEVRLAPGQAFEPDRPASLIKKAAERHGIAVPTDREEDR